jgi:ATP-binding cassette subfamily G (WHITE) protein 2 (PDR)
LLFLAKGGKTVYFGEIGQNSHALLEYFEANGARKCADQENPAEYMLEIVNGQGADWHAIWNSSPQRQAVNAHIEQLHSENRGKQNTDDDIDATQSEFAAPFSTQLWEVTARVFQQYWRMPSYIIAKLVLGIASGLFVGFSFYLPDTTLAGMSTVLFGVFMVTTIFTTLVGQIQPLFITQRSLYEVRERPSKAYSWKAFVIANIFVEIPWQILTGILLFACFYYPIAGVQSSERQVLVLLYIIQFLIYAGTVAQMTIAAMPNTTAASGLVTLVFMMSMLFCGVLQSPSALPGFWTFMYRVSPLTYWIGGIVSTQLHDRVVTCSAAETSIFNPPSGQTCGQYLADFLAMAPGQLQNPGDTSQCRYCSLTVADQFMAGANIYWDERWRNFGLIWAYIGFDIVVTVLVYYLFRVAKFNLGGSKTKKSKPTKVLEAAPNAVPLTSPEPRSVK